MFRGATGKLEESVKRFVSAMDAPVTPSEVHEKVAPDLAYIAPVSGVARRWWAATIIALITLVVTASPASAHTGFESSNPSDGQTIDQPVTEISVTFSGEATPAGEGFVVLVPSGQIREPDEVTSVDNLTWTLRFDEPLAGGVVGIREAVALVAVTITTALLIGASTT